MSVENTAPTSSTATASNEGDLTNHAEIAQKFSSMREEVDLIWNKIIELKSEISEHQQVIKALEPMDINRKCYRLVGDVMVQRTVGEVLPAVKQNEESLKQVVEKLTAQLVERRKALTEFQTKYKIRIKGQEETIAESDEKIVEAQDKAGPSSSSKPGVLISEN